VTYGAHARGQRERLSGDGLAVELAHWKGELAGAPEVLDLPTDRPRPALATFRGAIVPFELPAQATDALRRLAREERTTPFAALLAACAAVLARWSGQDELLLGVPVAGRPETELEGVVGLFANTLVVRAELHGRPTFRELLRRARGRTLAALSHQEVPFEHLVEELRPRRDLSRNPLFQAMFALQTMPRAALALGEARVEPLAVERGLAKVDLTLDLVEREGRLVGYLEHNLDLFDRTTATRLAAHVRRLIEAAAADPDRPLDEVELLTPAERHLLLHEGQGPARALPAGETVDGLIRRRAAADPDRPAVESAGGSWSYAQLRRAAGRVARELSARGIGAGDRVAVRAGRSREAVAAFLGVLEAGCAYVPLDPEYPEERLAFMLRDSGARVLLSGPVPEAARERTGERAAAAGEGIALLTLDADRLAEAGGPEPPEATGALSHPDQAAYVLYTSGTTGRPKGVVIPHRALLNHALAAAEAYGLGPEDRVLQFASTSFDIAGEEIYPSLLSGASLTLRPEGVAPSPAELAAFVAEHRLSVVNVPTPLWHEWVAELAPGHAAPPPCLRLVVVGTEGALPEPLSRWREALERLGHPDRPRWVNAYGPTEGTITATVYGPARGETERLARVPVGRPFANVRAHVLDPGFHPAPLGVPGELCLGGPGLAWGYLGRPAATAAAFVPNPLVDSLAQAHGPGSRLYRTGDRARRRADGEIEFLGRTDHQVKIRGFRIEPGEVEAVLAAHPGVREAVVVAREAGPGDRRLVAYAVEESPGAAPPEALRDHLAGRLPAYMVPSAFVLLDRLPLTPAGKVDRRALPEPDPAALAGGDGGPAPRGPVEELLAELFGELLGLDRSAPVGAHEDFFHLGGHSLLATRLVSRVRDRLGVDLPVRAVFEAPTVAGLAGRIAAAKGAPEMPPVVPVPRPASGPAELPLSSGQQRLWILDRLEPGKAIYNVPGAVRLETPDGVLDRGALELALAEIVARHEALRTTVVRSGAEPVQRIARSVEVRLTVTDLTALPAGEAGARAAALGHAESRAPFDLAAGPLFRFHLLALPGEPPEHRLLVTFHHAVADGWSIDLFLAELAALYDAFAAGRPSPLPVLPVQYGDYAVWQRRLLSGESLERLLAFWRSALDGAPQVLDLPSDRPRPPAPSYRGGRRYLRLEPETAEALAALGRTLGASPFMVTLAAFYALLARLTGGRDLLVGTPVAGRGRSELEGLIGFFVNTLVLRGDLRDGDAGPAVGDLLARVREATLDAFVHAELPFERLVEALDPDRDLSHNPLFQVMFSYQSSGAAPARGGDGPGLRPVLLSNYNDTARVDLALTLWPDRGGLTGFVEYAADLFDAATAARIAGWYGNLVRALAETGPDAAARAMDLPLLGPAERHQLLAEWNDAETPVPAGLSLHGLVAARAEAAPDAVAVAGADGQLTYRELTRRAARLAGRLRRAGVGPEALVGAAVERTSGMLVALLGILEAGGAYVPLDPAFPAERLAYMVEAGGLALVVTEEAVERAYPEAARAFGSVPRLRLGAGGTETDAAGAAPTDLGAPADLAVPPERLAYALFTSGSTGKPKGVQVPHGAAVNFLRSMAERPGLAAGETLLAVTTLSFDIALLELFLPLAVGGRVVVAPAGAARDGGALATLAARERADALQATPATWRLLVELPGRAWPGPPPGKALSGGEALPPGLAARLLDRLAPAGGELWNLYGPTETTVWSGALRVAREAGAADLVGGTGAVPVGGPVANTALHVLDPRGLPAPVGVAGELSIGGLGVARGYLGRPDQTAERFVPDSHALVPGGRLYRTGDLVRRRPDGRLDFLGRLDHQVKVRGFRIELGEIEAVLARQDGVAQAAVVAREDGTGERELVAYVVGRGEAPPAAALRTALREALPDYMVPALFVALPELPLTPNGKVDRKRLPEPSGHRSELAAAWVPPRNEVEATLAGLWAEVLRVDRVGAEDDFFALGGHSLKATQVMTRIEEVFGLELPLRALFESPTVAGLAERIEAHELETVDEAALAAALDEIETLSEDELEAFLAAGESVEGDE